MLRIQKISYLLTNRDYVQDIAQEAEDQERVMYDYIIVGAGISGLQAAQILIKQGKKVLVLQASKYLGGRIRTQRLKDLLDEKKKDVDWISKNPLVQKCGIEHGATWLSNQHRYVLKWVRELKLNMYHQYTDGVYIYGENQGLFKKVDSMHEFYGRHRVVIGGLVKLIESICYNIKKLEQLIFANPSNKNYRDEYQKYLSIYDTVTVKKFFETIIKDKDLLRLVLHQIQAQQCIAAHKQSVLQIIISQSAFANLKVYIGMEDQHPDKIKLKEGSQGLINGLIKKINQQYEKAQISKEQKTTGQLPVDANKWLRYDQPVLEIKNQIQRPYVQVVTKNNVYNCWKVIFSAPLAVSKHIKIKNISQSKKYLFDHQQNGKVMKVFLIFKEAFWRTKFSGNGYFSEEFPFTQVMEMSPPNLVCGILAFFFCADKIDEWQNKFLNYPEDQKESAKKEYLLRITADMFLQSDYNSDHLKNVLIAQRSFENNSYIKAGYQSITKLGASSKIQNLNKDLAELMNRDQNNIIFIGSEIAKKYATYIEGAIRCSREKIYNILGKPDPWSIEFSKFE